MYKTSVNQFSSTNSSAVNCSGKKKLADNLNDRVLKWTSGFQTIQTEYYINIYLSLLKHNLKKL